jgi:hypothetical protein
MDPAPTSIPPSDDREAWNRAYDRLMQFLNTFALGDHARVSRLALEFLERAREIHRTDPAGDPVTVTMRYAQKFVADWMAENLREEGEAPSRIVATGYVALLLSRLYRNAPGAFLQSPLPAELRDLMRRTLVVTGPDLNVSSMTPRHLDYGPMLDLARQTWHRWDARSFFAALAFWTCVYTILYLWLSGAF